MMSLCPFFDFFYFQFSSSANAAPRAFFDAVQFLEIICNIRFPTAIICVAYELIRFFSWFHFKFLLCILQGSKVPFSCQLYACFLDEVNGLVLYLYLLLSILISRIFEIGGFIMNLAKVSPNGQITVPVEIRRALKIKTGDKIVFFRKDNGEIVVNNTALVAIEEAQEAVLNSNYFEDEIMADIMELRYGVEET